MTGTQGVRGWSIYFSWSTLLFYGENVFCSTCCFARTPVHMPAFRSSVQGWIPIAITLCILTSPDVIVPNDFQAGYYCS